MPIVSGGARNQKIVDDATQGEIRPEEQVFLGSFFTISPFHYDAHGEKASARRPIVIAYPHARNIKKQMDRGGSEYCRRSFLFRHGILLFI